MYTQTKRTNKKSTRPGKNRAWLVLTVLILGTALVVAALELTNRTYIFHARKAVSGVIPSRPTPQPTNTSKSTDKSSSAENTVDSSGPTGSPESPKEGDAADPTTPTGAPPLTPYGNFISNHSPNLDGNPAPSSVQSVCNTTAGALCSIALTNSDGVVKTLASQKTDVNGATYWNWDVKQAGLTVGNWKVKVTASLNGQTTSASDAQDLVVGP